MKSKSRGIRSEKLSTCGEASCAQAQVCQDPSVCTYACTRICMYACAFSCAHVCMHTWAYSCASACMRACMRACVRACMHACVHVCVCPHIHTYTLACMHWHTYIPEANAAQTSSTHSLSLTLSFAFAPSTHNHHSSPPPLLLSCPLPPCNSLTRCSPGATLIPNSRCHARAESSAIQSQSAASPCIRAPSPQP